MRKVEYSIRNNIVKVLAIVLFLTTAQPAGELLVKAVGGSNEPKPYTSLSFKEPEKASRIIKEDILEFVVENHTNSQKKYYWEVIVNNMIVDQGNIEIDDKASMVVKTIPKKSGRLRIQLVGSKVYITGTVLEQNYSERENS
jgi:hypothetical protein